uniref:SFRICE_010705 n=1 Tax=Spodoptera frugiperda TaxID=7108 RepID=A0A2H1W3E4_SPOFR
MSVEMTFHYSLKVRQLYYVLPTLVTPDLPPRLVTLDWPLCSDQEVASRLSRWLSNQLLRNGRVSVLNNPFFEGEKSPIDFSRLGQSKSVYVSESNIAIYAVKIQACSPQGIVLASSKHKCTGNEPTYLPGGAFNDLD